MRRQRLLRVVEYEELVSGQDYLVRVADVKANHKTKRLQVHLEHRNPEQDGRPQEVVLPLPVRPNGQSAAFFRACGIDVQIDQEIDPDRAVGKQVMVRFEQGTDGRNVYFAPRTEEAHDGTPTR